MTAGASTKRDEFTSGSSRIAGEGVGALVFLLITSLLMMRLNNGGRSQRRVQLLGVLRRLAERRYRQQHLPPASPDHRLMVCTESEGRHWTCSAADPGRAKSAAVAGCAGRATMASGGHDPVLQLAEQATPNRVSCPSRNQSGSLWAPSPIRVGAGRAVVHATEAQVHVIDEFCADGHAGFK